MKAPLKTRKEWKQLLTGEINPSIKNFFFQMKITQAKIQIEKKIVPLDKAIEDLQTLCQKFIKANNMYDDLKTVFGSNYEEEDKRSVTKKEENTINLQYDNEWLNTQLQYEKQIMFYKNQLSLKEKELKEKEKLIHLLQEDNVILKKKNNLLYDSIFKINQLEEEGLNEQENSTNEKNWSFFKIFKKTK